MWVNTVDIILLAFLVFTALAIVRLRSLFAVVMLSGIYSLLMAVTFILLDAVDVAFTEAAVGAGVSTVLMLGTLALTTDQERVPRHTRIVPLLVVLVTGATLIYATTGMPRLGDPNAPIHQHVAPRYINESGTEVGVPNIVTSVLASYRGFDTLGEVAVIFTAGIGVMMVLGRRRLKPKPGEKRQQPDPVPGEGDAA